MGPQLDEFHLFNVSIPRVNGRDNRVLRRRSVIPILPGMIAAVRAWRRQNPSGFICFS